MSVLLDKLIAKKSIDSNWVYIWTDDYRFCLYV